MARIIRLDGRALARLLLYLMLLLAAFWGIYALGVRLVAWADRQPAPAAVERPEAEGPDLAAVATPAGIVHLKQALFCLDVHNRKLAIVGVKGEPKSPEEMDAILAERRANWKPKAPKYTKGLLKLYSQHAVSPMKGAYME